jgi:hypothetical protein
MTHHGGERSKGARRPGSPEHLWRKKNGEPGSEHGIAADHQNPRATVSHGQVDHRSLFSASSILCVVNSLRRQSLHRRSLRRQSLRPLRRELVSRLGVVASIRLAHHCARSSCTVVQASGVPTWQPLHEERSSVVTAAVAAISTASGSRLFKTLWPHCTGSPFLVVKSIEAQAGRFGGRRGGATRWVGSTTCNGSAAARTTPSR